MTSIENRDQKYHFPRKTFPVFVLGTVFVRERKTLAESKPRLLAEIEATIPEISIDRSSEAYKAISDRFCDFLPRTYASIATFCLLSEKRYQDISKDGLDSSRLFWQLGHKQDDIIDAPDRTVSAGSKVLQDIFSNDGIGHNKTIALLKNKITLSQELTEENKSYLLRMIASWFDLLKTQEDELSHMRGEDLSFEYCRRHREEQNMMAGRVVCALLSWEDCQTEKGQYVERALPQFSYMSQLIDDICDLPEDIEASRPSFALGALNEYPNEKKRIINVIKEDDSKKLSYTVLSKEAPNVTKLLDSLFDFYRTEASELGGKNTRLILDIARLMYSNYSKVKRITQRINPSWATF